VNPHLIKRRGSVIFGAVLLVLFVVGCQATFKPKSWYTSERFPTTQPGYDNYYYFGTGTWWIVSVDYKGDVEGTRIGSYRTLNPAEIEIEATVWGDAFYGTGSVTRTGKMFIRSSPPPSRYGLHPFPEVEIGHRTGCPFSPRVPLKWRSHQFADSESVIWRLDGVHPGVPIPWYLYLRVRYGEAKHLNLFKWLCTPKYSLPDVDSIPTSTSPQPTNETSEPP
jgi:hypothetical protein